MPLSGYTIKPIELPADTLMRLGGALTEQVRDLEMVHSRFFDNLRIWWKWYEAEPKTKIKTYPWRNASNVVAPVIRTQADSRTAQDFALLWGTKDRFYGSKSQNEDFSRTHLGPVTDFLNWAIEAEINPFWAILDWIHERNCIGTSVMSVSWDSTERYVFAPNSNKPERVVLRRGVRWNHHPAESILWEPGISVRDSEQVVVQYFKTATDLSHCLMQEDAGYNKDGILNLLKHPHINGSPGAQVHAEKDERAGVDAEQNISRRRIFDTRSIWVDWPVLSTISGLKGIEDLAIVTDEESGEKVRVPLIIDLAPDTKTVLRVLPNPYLMADGNPFFDIFYKKQSGYSRGVGLCKILEGPQRAQSTIINQSIDARTLQNAMPFKTTDPKLRERPITPGSGMYVTNIKDAEAFPIPGASPMDITLANLLQVYAERAGGTTDPMIGRESRSGGHPSPATNYMGQLQQGAKMGSVPTLILGQRLGEIGLYTASLYQQFDTDESGRLVRVFGAADAVKIRDWLFPNDMSLVGNMQLSLTALSDDNPQSAMQRSLMVSQVTQMYFGNILKLIQVLSMPQVPPPVKKAAVQAVKVLGDTHQDFLEASSYDEAQEAILRLDQGDMNAIAQLQQLAAQAGAGASAQGGADGAPPGGPRAVGGAGPRPNGAGQPGNGGVPELAGFSAGGAPPSPAGGN